MVNAVDGAKVVIDQLNVENKGWDFTDVAPGAAGVDPKYAIRGYVLTKHVRKRRADVLFCVGRPDGVCGGVKTGRCGGVVQERRSVCAVGPDQAAPPLIAGL